MSGGDESEFVFNASTEVSDDKGVPTLRWKRNTRCVPNVVHFERVAGANPESVAKSIGILRGMCALFGYPLYSIEEIQEALTAKADEVESMPVDGQEHDVFVELTDYRDMSRATVCFGLRRVHTEEAVA